LQPPQPPEGSTKVYAGATLEEAFAAAVRVHGPRVRPLQARQIRGGLRGLVGKDRFEVVVAVPSTPSDAAGVPATSGSVDVVLEELLDLADAEEQRVADAVHRSRTRRRAAAAKPMRSSRLETSVPADEPFTPLDAPSVVEVHVAPDLTVDEPAPLTHPAPAIAQHSARSTSVARAPRRQATPIRRQMRELGVPEVVLRRLPVEDPVTPAEWIAALTTAIGAAVPPPAAPSEQHPVVVSGHERAGVIAILHAGVAGWAPGTVVLDGRMVPATAEQLAWGVWTCVS
jgi:hypothetical protein